MEFIRENGNLIIIILAAIGLLVLFFAYFNTVKIARRLTGAKLKFKVILERGEELEQEKISTIVINRALSDMAIASIGVICSNKYFNFIKQAAHLENMNKEVLIIEQRSSVKIELETTFIEQEIIPALAKKKFKRVRVYAIDKSGNVSQKLAPAIKRVLKLKYKNDIKKQKEQTKNEFLENYKAKQEKQEKHTFKEKLSYFCYTKLKK